MKPPPRKRKKPDRIYQQSGPPSGKKSSQWQPGEQRNLLKALKRLGKTTLGKGDIDYDFLKTHVSTRSTSEIQSVVEHLKNEVISLAVSQLQKKKLEERNDRKPIEEWTHMASVTTGTLEDPISTAFSQMLIVSSTEPRTLRNRDPPQIYRPPRDKEKPFARTIPFRPMPHAPVRVEHPGTDKTAPVLVIKTPAPAMGPAKRLPAPSKVIRVLNSKTSPPQQQISATTSSVAILTSQSTAASTSQSAAASTSQSAAASTSQSTATSTSQSSSTSTSQSAAASTSQSAAASTSTSQSAAASTSQSAATCKPKAAKKLNAPSTSSQTVTALTGKVTPTSGSPALLKTKSGSSAAQTTQQPLEQRFTTSTSKSTSSTPPIPSQTPAPSNASSSNASPSNSAPPFSTSAAAFHAKFGHNYATEDSPPVFGVKGVVDFERIYRYLSVNHKPNEDCSLTPMESAVVLDLLMSLPEELPLLDCNKLHKHLIKMYRYLSSPADSKMSEEMFRELQEGLSAQTEEPSGPSSNETNGQQNSVATSNGGDVTDISAKTLPPGDAESQSAGSSNRLSPPPLNPFMVPLKLLKRK
ncbi:snRNA-activating protein complex subunit 2 [Plectropomus leopardus]|uniref:snRNA-activating protein complex subunit 2 n=1 Tax=Plectropomus leopardus TaxID=160734 RepID=UPI001C4A9887|nr:snRNA-activating protein complex subunit 2 [Plectropomus leopardus]